MLTDATNHVKRVHDMSVAGILIITQEMQQDVRVVSVVKRDEAHGKVRAHEVSMRQKLHEKFVDERTRALRERIETHREALAEIDVRQCNEIKELEESLRGMRRQIEKDYDAKCAAIVETKRSVAERAQRVASQTILDIYNKVQAELATLRLSVNAGDAGLVSKHRALFLTQCEKIGLDAIRLIIVKSVALCSS